MQSSALSKTFYIKIITCYNKYFLYKSKWLWHWMTLKTKHFPNCYSYISIIMSQCILHIFTTLFCRNISTSDINFRHSSSRPRTISRRFSNSCWSTSAMTPFWTTFYKSYHIPSLNTLHSKPLAGTLSPKSINVHWDLLLLDIQWTVQMYHNQHLPEQSQ